jgi:hypothetical protein
MNLLTNLQTNPITSNNHLTRESNYYYDLLNYSLISLFIYEKPYSKTRKNPLYIHHPYTNAN